MAAKAADIGMSGLVAATKGGLSHFGSKIGSYYKDQAKHGGLAADVAGIAANAIPGGSEVSTAVKVATTAVKAVVKGGSASQQAFGG